jgi:DNA repair exonuclease SbcCD ATPase subunit
MIFFKNIKWKNLLSTGNFFTEIDLSTKGTTLIIGSNGAGKSTILDALTFALFGKPFRNINKPQLLNSITKKELVVELEFEIHPNRYKIIRGIKPNVFEVYCNDRLLNQSAEIKDYQELLEKTVLKVNYKSFCQVVVLGSASFVPFMELPAQARRTIIEDLLDLEIFTTMNVLLKEKLQENNNAFQQNDSDRKIVEAKIRMVKEHLTEIQNKNEEFIRAKKIALQDIEKKIEEARKTYEEFSDEIKSKSVHLTNLGSVTNKVEKLKSLRAQMESKTTSLSKEIDFFNKHDNCPTCRQQISSDFSCEIVERRQNEIKEIESGLLQLATKYEETNEELKKILAVDKECNELRTKSSHESLKIKIFNDQIASISKEVESAKKVTKENSDIKVVDLEKDLTNLANQFNIIQDDKQVLSAAAILLKDGGIKTRIVNQYIPVINKLINKYLSEFDLFVEFNLDEQFNEVIKSRYKDDFSYASFSEGEKQKIDLSILFAWRAVAKLRNSLSTNLLILDEVFDSSLDGNAADDLLRILQNISKDSNVFIISHRDTLHDKFNSIIKFSKHKSFSRIEE